MKIKELYIKNIASIEEATINFEEEPLAGSDLFLITGPTGSGKTTILDCICLALYDTLPRLNKVGSDSQNKLDMSRKDTRQMVRRGAKESIARLRFAAGDGTEYIAEWRSGTTRNGTMGPKKRSLTDLSTGYLLTQGEAGDKIQELVGLDFSQFCRCTMLAQGEFTAFLKSNEKEKSDILEKITGMDIYSKIGKKVYEINKQKEEVYKAIEARMGQVSVLKDEERTALAEEMKTAGEQNAKLEKQAGELTAKKQWLELAAKNDEGVREAEKAEGEAAAQVESEEFKRSEDTAKRWNFTRDIRGVMAERKRTAADIAGSEAQLEAKKRAYAGLLCSRQRKEGEIRAKEALMGEKDEAIRAQEGSREMFENAQLLLAGLGRIAGNEADAAKAGEELARLREDKEKLDIEAAGAEEELKKSRARAEDLEAGRKELRDDLEARDLPGMRDSSSKLTEKISRIEKAELALENLKGESERRRKEASELEVLKGDVAKLEEAEKSAAQRLSEAESRKKLSEEEFEAAKNSADKWAKAMRLNLKKGCACPVCRRVLDEDLPAELNKLLDESLEAARAKNDEAKRAYEAAEKIYKDAERELGVQKNLYLKRSRLLEDRSRLDELEAKLRSACEDCGADPAKAAEELPRLKAEARKAREELGLKIAGAEEIEKKLRLKDADYDKARKEADLKAKGAQELRDKSAECQRKMAVSESRRAELLRAAAEDRKKAAGLIPEGSEMWQAARLEAAAKAYNKLIAERDELKTWIKEQNDMLENLDGTLRQIADNMPEWGSVAPGGEPASGDLRRAAIALLNDISGIKQRLNDGRGRRDECDSKLAAFYAANEGYDEAALAQLDAIGRDNIASMEKRIDDCRTRLRESIAVLENLRKSREDHLSRRPELSEGDTADSLAGRIETLKGLSANLLTRMGEIRNELKTDDESRRRVEAYGKDLEKARVAKNEWNALNDLLGDSDGKNFRKVAQSYILTYLVEAANKHLQSFSERYTLQSDAGTLALYLEDAFDGSNIRSINTVSGGESFVISLALALALAEIGGGLSVDTLFIDEGFGTLDPKYLDRAIAALGALQEKTGRRIGIISHVEKLRETIPVQIRLSRTGEGTASRVEVCV